MRPEERGAPLDGASTSQVVEEPLVVASRPENDRLRVAERVEEVVVDVGNVFREPGEHPGDVTRSKGLRVQQQGSPKMVVSGDAAFDRLAQDGERREVVPPRHPQHVASEMTGRVEAAVPGERFRREIRDPLNVEMDVVPRAVDRLQPPSDRCATRLGNVHEEDGRWFETNSHVRNCRRSTAGAPVAGTLPSGTGMERTAAPRPRGYQGATSWGKASERLGRGSTGARSSVRVARRSASRRERRPRLGSPPVDG